MGGEYEHLLDYRVDLKDKVLWAIGYNEDRVCLDIIDIDSGKEIIHSRIRNVFDMTDKNQISTAVMTLVLIASHQSPARIKDENPDLAKTLKEAEKEIKKSGYKGVLLEGLIKTALDLGLGGRT